MFSFIIPSLLNLQLSRQFSIHITMFALVNNDLAQHLCERKKANEQQDTFALTKHYTFSRVKYVTFLTDVL